MSRGTTLIAFAVLLGGTVVAQRAQPAPVRAFFEAGSADRRVAERALDEIRHGWQTGHAALLVDLARFLASPALNADGTRTGDARQRIVEFLQRQTGQRFGDDLSRWRRWLWSLPYEPHPEYLAFKAALYATIDPRMARFFSGASVVRLDQVEWGGVKVNGIPPLADVRHIPAARADWLKDSHVVFGIAVGGEARAYPKRILAWHEMARDRLGGVDLTIVYCTLCGAVIPYESGIEGVTRTFGTSGLLYRSNKLMFDEESQSLWSAIDGRPVIGQLARANLKLRAHPVVTTTWGEWRATHPRTTVLSIETGYTRDYGEDVAYRDYFATQQLMFDVPGRDTRLSNKDEVLGLFVPARGGGRQPVAFEARFLARRPVYHVTVEGLPLVVITSTGGANRVYDAAGETFVALRGEAAVVDRRGTVWRITEDALVRDGVALARRPAFRAFWFGWVAQFPDTELITGAR